MPLSHTTYQARKQAGVCPYHPESLPLPGYVLCETCHTRQDGARGSYMAQVRTDRGHATPLRSPAPQPPPVQLAHCGQWHTVTAVPMVLPCCGAVYFEPQRSHACPTP